MCDECYWNFDLQPCSYVEFMDKAYNSVINSTLVPVKQQGIQRDYIMWTVQFRNGAMKRIMLSKNEAN